MVHRTLTEVSGADSLCALFQSTAKADSDKVALRSSDGTVSWTWSEYDRRVRQAAAGLAALGVTRGDTVGLMLLNRPEFNVLDAAALHMGAVPFSVYTTNPADQIAYLFANADNRVVICEQDFLAVVTEASAGTAVEHIVCVQGDRDGATLSLDAMLANGDPAFDFDAAWQQIGPDDLATLIFTSGTEGNPKGVELTHYGLLQNLAATFDIVDVSGPDRVLSYLPDAHIVNRYMAHYAPMVFGVEVTTVIDRHQLVSAMTAVRPTLFVAVPMLWYRLIGTLETTLADAPLPAAAFVRWAVEAGRREVRARSEGQSLTGWLAFQHRLADRLVLTRLRARLGLGEAKIALSGSAPISDEAMEFILGIGLPVCEAWGMSELGTLGTVNLPDSVRLGTVGRPSRGVEIKLGDHNEVLVRSSGVMRGYRKQPELTARTIDEDGWLHTGDVGHLDADGYLTIVDRIKEIIINTGGKNMSPSNIENRVRTACPLAGAVVAIGDARPYVVALVALEPDVATAFAEKHGLAADAAVLAKAPELLAAVQEGIDKANEKLSRVEQIKHFTVAPTFWEPGGDELTPTMKLRRRPISAKYADEIDALYANAARPAGGSR